MNTFRTTAREAELIDMNCTLLRLKKSDFLRLVALLPASYTGPGPQRKGSILAIDNKAAGGVYHELAAQGTNLNQGIRAVNRIAKSVRQGSRIDSDAASELAAQLAALHTMFGKLLAKNEQLLEAARPLYDAQPILRLPPKKAKAG